MWSHSYTRNIKRFKIEITLVLVFWGKVKTKALEGLVITIFSIGLIIKNIKQMVLLFYSKFSLYRVIKVHIYLN